MWNKITYEISQHFACALEYGDYGDMSKQEIYEFDVWLHAEQDGNQGHWSIDDCSENYGKCEVTGLQSNLMVVSWNFKE